MARWIRTQDLFYAGQFAWVRSVDTVWEKFLTRGTHRTSSLAS